MVVAWNVDEAWFTKEQLTSVSTLGRATDPPMSDHCAKCALCDAEAESVPIFYFRAQ